MSGIFDPYRIDALLAGEEAAEARSLERMGAERYIAGLGRDLARLSGRKHCVFTDSGRAAIAAGLAALGSGRGKTVVLNNLTHHSLLEAVLKSKARPLPVEAGPRTLNPGSDSFKKLAKDADILLLAHMFACGGDVRAIKTLCLERGIKTLEDASQAIGLKYAGKPLGSFGDISVLSLSPYKPVSRMGIKAGALLFDDDKYYRLLPPGAPELPPGLEAAAPMLKVKLKNLPLILLDLKGSNARFRARLKKIPQLRLAGAGAAAQEIPLFVNSGSAAGLSAFLDKAGIKPERKYTPFHTQLGLADSSYQVSALYRERALHLPVYCKMTESEIDYVCSAIERFFKKRRA
ncbi:MAG: DegT/DnrJ/EryC1/StrS family aminotransferase [Elusimicrobia bacterium]|nr:DegT/DnrJ/EryC1/StrS family aminotransferase [Elusimicrobiota bacterium]